jgi:hypothetical protein
MNILNNLHEWINLWTLQDESRWEREIGRLQQVAAADLQRIRQEAKEAAQREARMLRCGTDRSLAYSLSRVHTARSDQAVRHDLDDGLTCG